MGVSEGKSKIVESWKLAYDAFEPSKKENSSGNKAAWNPFQEKAGDGVVTVEHFKGEKFGSNQDRYDACGSSRDVCL